MQKLKAFNMVEIMIVVSLMLSTLIICLPVVFNNSKEARIISGWKRIYAEIESNFEVYNISDRENIEKICTTKGVANKEQEIFKIISPYLNVNLNADKSLLSSYHYRFKNGAQVSMKSQFFTKNFSYQDNGNIVGFKWLSCECNEETPCAVVLFDMNGVKKPNKIGKDIFVMSIYKNKIKSFGSELTNNELAKECTNPHSNGINCSEYFLRGGKF